MSAETLRETRKGTILAVRYCGHWPSAAFLDEYVAAAHAAEAEVNRAIETWVRWRRRFSPAFDRLELGSGRTNVRHSVALSLLEGRNEAIALLIGPEEGSA